MPPRIATSPRFSTSSVRVADLDQPGEDLFQVRGVAGVQRDRLKQAEPADDRLQQPADRGGHDGQRPGPRVAVGGRPGQPAQHRDPLAGGVRAG
jgi:hypothetical protein